VLHVRIASPPDVTGRLVETLAADPGVLNLVVLRGAARQPDGDAVQFDLRTRSANPVFQQLRDQSPDVAVTPGVAVGGRVPCDGPGWGDGAGDAWNSCLLTRLRNT
jgi:hypothetical protein